MLDDTDRALLRALQNDPAASVAALAARAGTSAPVATRRLERMREAGVLRGQRARIDWGALGHEIEVSLRITLEKAPGALEAAMAAARAIPEVVEIQTFLGRVDLRLSVVARDLAHYDKVYRARILPLPNVTEIESLMRLATLKDEERLPF